MEPAKFLIIGLMLFWVGFVSAISFMESWIKFRVKGVTLPIGLSIGRKVFTSMNRVEWVLVILFIITWLYLFNVSLDRIMLLPALVLFILAAQTFYLLPALDKRANLIIEGKSIEKSNLHVFYVTAELVKVCLLLSIAFLYATQV